MDLNNQPPTLCPKQLSNLKKKAHEENIWSCAYGQSEKDGSEYIITGSLDNNVKVWKWNVVRLEYIRTCEGHRLGVLSVDINKSGTLAASSSLDAQIIIWDLESGQQMRSFDGAANLDAWTLMFSPDSRFIATGCQEGDINLIGVDSGKIERTISLKGKFCLSIAYSPLGTHLAAGALNGMINICDIQTGQLKSQDGHAMPVRGLAFSHDGQRLVSASDDGQIKVYDVWFTNNDIDYFHYLIHLFSTNENGIVALISSFNALYSTFNEYLNTICDEEPHLIIIGQFYNSLRLILPTINVVVANMAANEALNLLQSEPNVLDNLVRLAYTCSLHSDNTSIQEIYLEISSLFNTIISITHSNLIHSENYDLQQFKWLQSVDVGACIPQLQAFLSCCTRNESTKLKLLEITQKLNLSYLYEAMTDGKIE